MNTFKYAAFAMTVAGMFSTHTFAKETSIQEPKDVIIETVFSQNDIYTLFDQTEATIQLLTLSKKEMKETKGALLRTGLRLEPCIGYCPGIPDRPMRPVEPGYFPTIWLYRRLLPDGTTQPLPGNPF